MDETRESFLFLSVSEIVSELAVFRPEGTSGKTKKLRSRWISRGSPRCRSSHAAPAPSAIRIFCLAANDQARRDHVLDARAITGARGPRRVLSLPVGFALRRDIDPSTARAPGRGCISALPPFAFAQSHALCQRGPHAAASDQNSCGHLGIFRRPRQSQRTFRKHATCRVVASIAQAVEQISEWATPRWRAGSAEPLFLGSRLIADEVDRVQDCRLEG